MSIKYVQFTVSIHGLDADQESLEFLAEWIRGATKAGLAGRLHDGLKFRNEFDSDIEVEIVEQAGF